MQTNVSVPRWQIDSILRERFKLQDLKETQLEIIEAILRRQHVISVLRTGGGKSLCFQLPAVMQSGATAIVVSPLIALMNDQVAQLKQLDIKAECVHSQLSDKQIQDRLLRLAGGEYRLIYVSPERLQTEAFLESMDGNPVSLLAVDEGHCVSMWGHDFRPEYSRICDVYKRLGNPPVAVFTGTARPKVIDDIAKKLRIPNALRVIGELDRPNLKLAVEKLDTEAAARERVLEIARKAIRAKQSTAVYSLLVTNVSQLAFDASSRKVPHALYHGQLSSEERSAAEHAYLTDKVPVIFCTSAFGMGVNKSNIHRVVHYGLPPSIEQYWQEVSRGGRDGSNVDCTIVLPPGYRENLRGFIRATQPTTSAIERVYRFACGAVKLWPNDREVSTYFDIEYIVDHPDLNFSRSDITSCLAVLNEQNVLRVRGPRITFLVPPDEVKKRGYLVEEATLLARKEAAAESAEQMIRLLDEDLDLRPTIVSYLKGEDIPSRTTSSLPAASLERDDVLESIVLALAHRNLLAQQVLSYFCGHRKIEGPHFGILRGTQDRDVRRAQERAESLDLIAERTTFGSAYWSVTDKGYAYLAERNIQLLAIDSYESFAYRLRNRREILLLRRFFGSRLDSAKDMSEEDALSVAAQTLIIEGVNISATKLIRDFCALKRKPTADDVADFLTFLANEAPG